MNAVDREQTRLSLLRYLSANPTQYGLPARYLKQALATEGTVVSIEEVLAELQYLADKTLIIEVAKILSPENQAWRITAAGRDLLARQGA